MTMEQQQHQAETTPRVGAMVAALVRAAPLIDGSTAGQITIAWLDGSSPTISTTIDGPWAPPPCEGTAAAEGER